MKHFILIVSLSLASAHATSTPTDRRAREINSFLSALTFRLSDAGRTSLTPRLRAQMMDAARADAGLRTRYPLRPWRPGLFRAVTRLAARLSSALERLETATGADARLIVAEALGVLFQLHVVAGANAGGPPDLMPEARVITVPTAAFFSYLAYQHLDQFDAGPYAVLAMVTITMPLGLEFIAWYLRDFERASGTDQNAPANVSARAHAHFWNEVRRRDPSVGENVATNLAHVLDQLRRAAQLDDVCESMLIEAAPSLATRALPESDAP